MKEVDLNESITFTITICSLKLQLYFMSRKGSPIRRLQLFNKEAGPQSSALAIENQKLNSVIYAKNLEIKNLLDQNKLIKINFEEQITSYKKTIALLQKQLQDVEISRNSQFQVIKQKYDKLAVEESESLKNYHSHQMEFLLKQIAHLRVDIETKSEKINLQEKQSTSMKESYERELVQKITEINNLNKALLVIQDNKNKEIKDLASKRELQRSRTNDVLSSRKENSHFMDKQLRKLNEQVLDKAIKIENLTRELSKLKKKSEQNEKNYQKRIETLITEKEDQLKQREDHFTKIQKSLKEEIIQFKSKEVRLLGEIDTLNNQIEFLKADIRRKEEAISIKQNDIKEFKSMLDKEREEHVKQINKLMKEKRRRSSNLGSSRSLTSSLKGSGIIEEQPQSTSKKLEFDRLPTVREESPDKNMSRELERSNITDDIREGEQDNQLAKVVYHYDALIDEIKRSHNSELQLVKHKLEKASQSLQEKQQQILDILTRFSPLVKIHAGQKSVEQDRKERIERHWKADLALLEILLERYKIQIFQ